MSGILKQLLVTWPLGEGSPYSAISPAFPMCQATEYFLKRLIAFVVMTVTIMLTENEIAFILPKKETILKCSRDNPKILRAWLWEVTAASVDRLLELSFCVDTCMWFYINEMAFFTLFSVMANLMAQPGWAMGCPGVWSNIILWQCFEERLTCKLVGFE